MMSDDSEFDEILTDDKTMEKFCKWYWKGNIGDKRNSNKLVEVLNTSTHRSAVYVRIEKFRPCIYGVALKHIYHKDWQFVKIGYTHVDTSENVSRMTKIEEEIDKVYGNGKGKTIFVLAIDPDETKTYTEVEKTFRQELGIPVQKKLAKKLSFPVPSEWVMTTTAFSKKFLDDIKSATDKRNAHTGLLKNKFIQKTDLPLNLKPPENINYGKTVQIFVMNEEICLKDSDISYSSEASGKQAKNETKQGESSLKKDTSDSPEASGKQAKKETKQGESSLKKDTSDSPEASGKKAKKETKQGESSLKKESDTSDSPEASGKQAKALKETKTEEPSLKKKWYFQKPRNIWTADKGIKKNRDR